MSIKPVRVDAFYLATFGEPAFAFLKWPDLYEAIFRRFSPWVRPEDILWESQSTHPSALQVTCNLLEVQAVVKFRLMNVEVWNGSASLEVPGDSSLWSEIIGRTTSLVGDLCAEDNLPFASHAFSLNVHWQSPTIFADELKKWTRDAPQDFRASGVAFVKESQDAPRTTVDFQPSLLVPEAYNNGFARIKCEFPGSVSADAAYPQALLVIRDTLKRFDIDFELTK